MIELPEAMTMARQIGDVLRGKRVARVVANASPHGFAGFAGDPAGYPALFVGRNLEGARAFGGHVAIRFQQTLLLLNDGAYPHYLPADAARPAKHQLLIEFEDGTGMYCSVRMYGGMSAYGQEGFDNGCFRVACERPSPLTDEFDAAYFASLRAAAPGKLSAKAFLATEQRIPGLGNGVLQDILYNAGVHPMRRIATLADADWEVLHRAVRTTLREMADGGGRDVEQDFLGRSGGYRTKCSRLTVGKHCPICAATISKRPYLGGVIYYCPGCQPLA